jgi:hypothetical protein
LIQIYQQLVLKKESLSHANDNDLHRKLNRQDRSQSVLSNDAQLQFYDAIEYLTSDSDDTETESEESDIDGGDDKSILSKSLSAIVPGKSFSYFCFLLLFFSLSHTQGPPQL